MYSLNDVQQNLKALLKELRVIQDTVAGPQNRKKYNSQTMLLKIPKGLLLAQICKYLTVQQINYLSTSCSGLRKTIYSPLGWKILIRLKTPYPLQVVSLQSDFKVQMKSNALDASMEHFQNYNDEKFIYLERNKYKSILVSQYTMYLKSKQKFEAYRDKIKCENGALFKIRQQVKYLKAVKDDLDDQNKMNKQKLKSLSEGFSAKIKDMDDQSDALLKQRTKLQNQKQALAGKIRQYQHQIQVIKQDSQKSKQILRRLKNYLLFKEL